LFKFCSIKVHQKAELLRSSHISMQLQEHDRVYMPSSHAGNKKAVYGLFGSY